MMPEEQEDLGQLTAQVKALHVHLLTQNMAPAPATPAPALPPMPCPPEVAAPSPFMGAQDDLEHFKAECILYKLIFLMIAAMSSSSSPI